MGFFLIFPCQISLEPLKIQDIIIYDLCPGGEIGRHARLRI